MASPERDNYYTADRTERTYVRESNSTAWFVGIIVALALLAIGYLVFSANSGPSSTTIDNSPSVTVPAPAPDTTTSPDTTTTPMTTAPADQTAPAAPASNDNGSTDSSMTAPANPAPAAPASATPAAPAAQ